MKLTKNQRRKLRKLKRKERRKGYKLKKSEIQKPVEIKLVEAKPVVIKVEPVLHSSEPKVEVKIIKQKIMPTVKRYSIGQGILKGIKYLIIFAIPFALQILPTEILNLTLGGFLTILYNLVKIKWLPKLI